MDTGDLPAAIRQAVLAVDLDPRYGEGYATIVQFLRWGGRLSEADDWLKRGLVALPDDPPLLIEQARALQRVGDLAAAREICDRLAASGHEAWMLQAQQLQREGRMAEALAIFDQVIPASAEPNAVIVAKAAMLIENGDMEAARAEYDRVLKVEPGCVTALAGRVTLLGARAGEPEIEKLERLLDPGLPLESRRLLNFALGNAYLEKDEPDRAFGHFKTAHAILRQAHPYDSSVESELVTSIIDAFGADAVQSAHGAGPDSPAPVFITGMPRTGTSLLEQMMAGHAEIHGAGELWLLPRAIRSELNARPRFLGGVPDITRDALSRLGHYYLDRILALGSGAKRIVDKLPINSFHAGLIHMALPNARIINMRRAPLDASLSIYTSAFEEPMPFADDLGDLGRFWNGYERLTAHWRSVLPVDRFIDVEYHRLVENPEDELRRILSFCGMAWDSSCLKHHELRRPVRTVSRLQVRRPIYRSSIGRADAYRAYLGDLIEALLEPTSS